MHVIRRIKSLTYAVTVLAVFVLQTGQAQAGLVATDTVFQDAKIISTAQQNVLALLNEQSVIDELTAMGVEPASVKQRVANLTDEELLELQNKLQSLPAGGIDAIAAALIVFLVLLATDIAGLTDIFPFVKKQ